MEVQDNYEMRKSNTYVLHGLQNEINVEVQDNCKMRNSNKYVLRGLQNEFNDVFTYIHILLGKQISYQNNLTKQNICKLSKRINIDRFSVR